MAERFRGSEALKREQFRRVTLPRQAAIATLTQTATETVFANADSAIHFFTRHQPEKTGVIRRLHEIKDDVDGFKLKGGLFFNVFEVENLHWDNVDTTFQQAVQATIRTAEEKFTDPLYLEKRNPGISLIGYFMEMVSIIDEGVASREAGIEVIIDSMQKSKAFGLKKFGAIIFDAVSGKLPISGQKDIMSNSRGAAAFRDAVLKVAGPEERELITSGIEEQREKTVISRIRKNRRWN